MVGIYEKDIHVHLCILGICVKFKKSLSGKNNKILIKSNGKVLNCRKRIKGLDILINGNDNTIIIETPYKFNCSRIICNGNNNTIIIGGTKYGINSLFIDMRVRKNNRTVNIGKNTKIIGANLHALSDSSSIEIGENCLLSWGIEIMNGDAHKIYDMKTQQVINQGGYCKIGNHVWIGCRSFIGKNVIIADNNVIGACSTVTKQFQESNTVIAGTPAKVIKNCIEWDIDDNF